MCLGVFLFGFILTGTLYTSWTLLTISFPTLGKFLAIIFSNIFSGPFFLSSLSGTPIMWMLVCLILSQRSPRLSSLLFIIFSIVYSAAVFSSIQSSRSFIQSSASDILLWIPSSVLFISVCLFFSSCRSLANISWIFSIFAYILFLRFWIIFTIIILNSFSGGLQISTFVSCFSGVLSCPFIWDITFCFFIVINIM